MDTFPRSRRVFRPQHRIAIATATMAVAALGFFGLRAWNTGPAVVIPSPRMPTPNAYDTYRAAGNLLRNEKQIGDAYQRGPDGMGGNAALVARNAPALAEVRCGLGLPYRQPPSRSLNDKFPYYAQFRDLARLLVLEGEVKQEHRDWAGAVNSDLDAVCLGTDIPHGSGLIGDLTGIACQAIGRHRLWGSVNHLTAPQARAACRRLEAIESRHVAFADVLQEEKWTGQSVMKEAFQSNTPPVSRPTDSSSGNDENTESNLASLPPWVKRLMLHNYTRYMDQGIANARRPYAAHPPDPPMPKDPLSQIMVPVFIQARVKDAENPTQNALLMTVLALRAYRIEHGEYPATLNALAPQFLSRVPGDPFASSGPLHYRRTGTGYLLYSLGPDAQDDGGKPIFDASKHGPTRPGRSDPRYFVLSNSRGDVVAGVNKS